MRIKFVPQDCWVGLYWKTKRHPYMVERTYYLCILPMLPIIWTRAWREE